MGSLEQAVAALVQALPQMAGTLEVMAKRIERLERQERGPDLAGMALDPLVTQWVAEQANQATIGQSAEYVKKMARLMGWKTLADITPDSIRAYLAQRTKAGLTDQTVRREAARLGGFFRWVKRHDPRVRSPLRLVNLPPVSRGEGKAPLDAMSVHRLITSLTGTQTKHYRRMVYMVAAGTALRPSQLFRLKVGHVHLDEQPPVIRLPAAFNKSRNDHQLPVHEALVTPLRVLVEGRRPDQPVFPRTVGIKVFRTDLKRAGVEHVERYGFSSLRKYVATALADAGVPVDGAQRILGHAHSATTQVHYQRPGMKVAQRQIAFVPLPRTPMVRSGSKSTEPNAEPTTAFREAMESHLGDLNPGPMLYESNAGAGRGSFGQCSGEHESAQVLREQLEQAISKVTRGVILGLLQSGVIGQDDLVSAVTDAVTPTILAQALARRRGSTPPVPGARDKSPT